MYERTWKPTAFSRGSCGKEQCGFSRCDMDFSFERTFFVTSVTWQRRPAFQCEHTAKLFLQVLFEYRQRGIFLLHEFVLMPDHIHLLLTPRRTVAIERAMQFIKGGFSHRVMKETGSRMEIWERSFTNHRIRDQRDYAEHIKVHLDQPGPGAIGGAPRAICLFISQSGVHSGSRATAAKAGRLIIPFGTPGRRALPRSCTLNKLRNSASSSPTALTITKLISQPA